MHCREDEQRMKNASFEHISRQSIDSALDKKYRQYLVGHLLKDREEFNFIEDDIEVGISYYREFTADKPHFHTRCTSHSYVLTGNLRVKLLDTGEEHELGEGDFFTIRPKTPYAVKNAAGTKVLFIKAPAGNDKVDVSPDESTHIWLSSWD